MEEKEKKVVALEAAIRVVGSRYLQRQNFINRRIREISNSIIMWKKQPKVPSFVDLEDREKDIVSYKKRLDVITKEGDELVKLLKDVLEDYKNK